MDPVTHILLGAAAGHAGFGRRLGGVALVAGGLAAFAPDVDVFIRSARDPLLAIEHHRGFTHSLLFAPLGAAVVATLWRPWRQGVARARLLWLCCLTGYLSHALLDAATSYGTQLLWPFSRHRAGWDVISIIDPVFTAVLALGVAIAILRRRPGPVRCALAVAGLYLALGAWQHHRADAAQEQLAIARGHVRARAEVMPTLANHIVWRGLYEHEGRIHSDRIRVGWFSRPTIRTGFSLPRTSRDDLTPVERRRDGNTDSFARFNWFSERWVARNPADSGLFGDMRYSLSTEAFDPVWGIRFTAPDAAVPVAWVNRTRERRIEVAELWTEITGRDPRFVPLTDAR